MGSWLLALALARGPAGALADPQPNPPVWPDSVLVFDPPPGDEGAAEHGRDITEKAGSAIHELNFVDEGHFSDRRIALLFKPGTYKNVNIHVGYYTQVLGLGESADDVTFTATERGVHSLAMGEKPDPGSLDDFWRGAENFKNDADVGMTWAVSQAAPLRRIHVTRNLTLFDENAWASGGFMANVRVDGNLSLGGQQQWMTRNAQLAQVDTGAAWNLVFVGASGAPEETRPTDNSSKTAITTVPQTPIIAEKPFITIDKAGKYYLQVPPVRENTVGVALDELQEGTTTYGFEKVFVAIAEKHDSKKIQAMLDDGLHVVLAAGVFNLSNSLVLSNPSQVLLGIGMATLVAPTDGSPCIKVKAPNVSVAGIMLAAAHLSESATNSSLLQWGDAQEDASDGVMNDVFARVGGPELDRRVGVDTIMTVNSQSVIGDNLWLWRADHAKGPTPWDNQPDPEKNPKVYLFHLTMLDEYPCKTGLEVYGNDVTMYGLFVEHTTEHLTRWHGGGGRVFFYQSELPYEVNKSYAENNYSGYMVAPDVQSHQVFGAGVYIFFRDYEVNVQSAIRAPENEAVTFTNVMTRFLNGQGTLQHVINDQGVSVAKGKSNGHIASMSQINLECPNLDCLCPGLECPQNAELDCEEGGCSSGWNMRLVVTVVAIVLCVVSLGVAAFFLLRVRALSPGAMKALSPLALWQQFRGLVPGASPALLMPDSTQTMSLGV